MDARTGELWTEQDAWTAKAKVIEGRFDDLTESEKRYILAAESGNVAWITPEVAEQVKLGQMAQLREAKQAFETRLQEMESRD